MEVTQSQVEEVLDLITPKRLERLNAIQRKELDSLIRNLENSVVREKGQESFFGFLCLCLV